MEIKNYITDSLRYWEPRRIIYNIVLAAITIAYAIPFAKADGHAGFQWPQCLLHLLILAAGANILYCAAYPVDVFIQCSHYRALWLRLRWMMFITGLALASALTWFYVSSMFCPVVNGQ